MLNNTTENNALVVGDTGIIGSHVVSACAGDDRWNCYGLSRRERASVPGTSGVLKADLMKPDELRSTLSDIDDITHLFYFARSPNSDPVHETHINTLMFKNVLDATCQTQANLKHVHLMEGMKWYGSHLGTWKTPAVESDPRAEPPNMYYDQQDELVRRSTSADWTWSALRPHQIAGFATHYPHNLAAVIGVYSSICVELGLPLAFPGSSDCYESVSMITDANLLADAILWLCNAQHCANRAFNITNGDLFRWKNLWPEIACFFNLECRGPQPMSLVDFMQDKKPVWDRIRSKHELLPLEFEDIANWRYGDFSFRAGCDDIASTIEIRQEGFSGCMDSHRCMIDVLKTYRSNRVIP